jgi:hypothetical protein
MGKTKVRLVFNSPFMRDRTINVKRYTSKERREFTICSTVSLKSLTSATSYITGTTYAILDFTEAFELADFTEEERVLLMPSLKEVFNRVRGATGDVMMKGKHRMMRLQSVLKRVPTRLHFPKLFACLTIQKIQNLAAQKEIT